jgi:radical SAM superfamily enzyme YgiQ (UPF0313 family)
MKVLLIQPPVQDFYDTDIRLQPLGLCFLKAALTEHCPDVEVIVRDFHHGCGRQTIAIPQEFHYLKEYYKEHNGTPFSSFNHYYHFGLPFEEIAEKVRSEKPDLVGISSLFAPYYREVLRCAEAIKKRWGTIIVVGGGQATCSPSLMLENPAIDYIVRGEGEKPLVELAKALMSGGSEATIAGLGYKREGRIHLNPVGENFPFNTLPCPDFADLSAEKYLYRKKPMAFVQTSRGCPHRCSFCSVHQIFGRSYRRRNPEHIIAEMEHRYQDGVRVFDFEDDNLTLKRSHILDLCNRISEKFTGGDITLLAMNGISYNNLDPEILQHMKKAGFSRLNLALVSSERQVLQGVNRPHCPEKLQEVVHAAFSLGFDLEVHQIIGLPNESLASMANSMAFLGRLPVLIGVSIFYLTPGTDIARQFPAMEGKDIFMSRSTAMARQSEECGRDDLFTLFTTARIINFLKGIEIEGAEISLEELLHRKNKEKRIRSGIEILTRLLTEKKFYTAHKDMYAQQPGFRYSTFEKVWENKDSIITQNGKKISLR